jgi:hypothetical protein
MSDATTLRALVARVEAATGPDRELAKDIMQAVKGARFLDGGLCEMGGWYYATPGRDDDNPHPPLPDPTASLDAAASLVPAGWTWRVDSGDYNTRPIAFCVPNEGRLPWPAWITDIEAATPALALCAAALRARGGA